MPCRRAAAQCFADARLCPTIHTCCTQIPTLVLLNLALVLLIGLLALTLALFVGTTPELAWHLVPVLALAAGLTILINWRVHTAAAACPAPRPARHGQACAQACPVSHGRRLVLQTGTVDAETQRQEIFQPFAAPAPEATDEDAPRAALQGGAVGSAEARPKGD